MIFHETMSSGLLVPVVKPPTPPEHEVRLAIRERLSQLLEDLEEFEQTTHGVVSDGSIRSVASALQECYDDPRAYTISDLHQLISQFLANSQTKD